MATCSADTTVKIWSATNHEFKLDKELKGHQRWVWDCAFSADSAYLVTGKYSYKLNLLLLKFLIDNVFYIIGKQHLQIMLQGFGNYNKEKQ